MKIQGAVWEKFYNDEKYWEGYWHDDTLILFDGVEVENYDRPGDRTLVEVEAGDVLANDELSRSYTLTGFFTRWKKLQDTEVIVVTVEKARAKDLRKEIKSLGGVKEVK